MPICASKPSAVRASGRPITPALFTRTSTVSTEPAKARTLVEVGEIELTDFDIARHIGGGLLGLGDVAAGNHHAVSGCGASAAAVALPTPLLPPVTMIRISAERT